MTSFNLLPSIADLPAWPWTLLGLASVVLLRVLLRARPNLAREPALRTCVAHCGPAESVNEQASLERPCHAPREHDGGGAPLALDGDALAVRHCHRPGGPGNHRPLAHAADTAPLTSVPHRTRRN